MEAEKNADTKATIERQLNSFADEAIASGANEKKKLTQDQIQLVIIAAGNLAATYVLDKASLEIAKKLPDSIEKAIGECKEVITSSADRIKANPLKAGKIGKEMKGTKVNLAFMAAAASATVPSMLGR